MLELRPNCECCNEDLPPDAEAYICTFECTFCRRCTTDVLKFVCPNCSGNLSPRPSRPKQHLAKYPASKKTVANKIKIIRSKDFNPTRAWDAIEIANMNGTTTRLHWTDKPYKWHINDGEEVFLVIDGKVEMKYKEDGTERSTILNSGDIFFAAIGTAHVAHPICPSRILVIEQEGSV